MNNARSFKTIAYAAFIIVTVIFVYKTWPQRTYTGDDLQYAMLVEATVTEGEAFYHPAGYYFYDPLTGKVEKDAQVSGIPLTPRYLLEFPTSVAFVKLWRLFGWQDNVLLPMLVLRMLVGVLGAVLFFLAMQLLSNSNLIAAISSIGLATSYTYWIYSTRIDYTINLTALTCLALYLLVLRYKTNTFNAVNNFVIMAVLVVATFYSWIAGLSAFVFAWAIAFWQPNKKMGNRARQFVKLSAVYGILVLLLTVLIISVFDSPQSLISLDYWKSAGKAGRLAYNVNVLDDAWRTVLGFARAQIPYPGEPGSFKGFHYLIFALMSVPLWILFFERRQLSQETKEWTIFMIAWMIPFGAFIWFWLPHIKYYPMPLMSWWGIVALTLKHIKQNQRKWYSVAIISVLIFIFVTIFVNLTVKFSSPNDKRSHEWRSVALELKNSQPNALFISPKMPPVGHPLSFYIVYFARRNAVSVGHVGFVNREDEQVIRQIVTAHIQQHRAAGGPVYVYGIDSLPQNKRDAFLSLLDGQQLEIAWSFSNLTIYKVIPASGKSP